jgi:predicted phage terminase large subunit-like protein
MTDATERYKRLLEDNPQLARSLRLRLTSYIPHDPTAKQHLFLLLNCREALFGGAAGGGKSDALLMGALQYVDCPGYSAILFRRTKQDAKLPGAILSRCKEWLTGTDCKWDGDKVIFPSGARIEFGYLDSFRDKYRYQGAEFQFIGFDELTQFPEEDYLYLFSRLRKPYCPFHKDAFDDGCRVCHEYEALRFVPLRMRAATNPGGLGHLWVKRRFDIGQDKSGLLNPHTHKPLYTGRNPSRPFIPSFVQDNPYLDFQQYIQSLRELDPVTREQLLNGDWGVSADGRFKRAWLRRYAISGPYVLINATSPRIGEPVPLKKCFSFVSIDPAASSLEGPATHRENTADSHWSMSNWLITPRNDLILWDHQWFRCEVPDALQRIRDFYGAHVNDPNTPHVSFIGLEWSALSSGVYQTLAREGYPMRPWKHGGQDKLVRATDAMNRMEQGKVFVPLNAPWLEEWETEIFTWTAHPNEQDDQIDEFAYAARFVAQKAVHHTSERRSPYVSEHMNRNSILTLDDTNGRFKI